MNGCVQKHEVWYNSHVICFQFHLESTMPFLYPCFIYYRIYNLIDTTGIQNKYSKKKQETSQAWIKLPVTIKWPSVWSSLGIHVVSKMHLVSSRKVCWSSKKHSNLLWTENLSRFWSPTIFGQVGCWQPCWNMVADHLNNCNASWEWKPGGLLC